MRESVSIRCEDGYVLAGDWRQSERPFRGGILIAPALGIPRSYYSDLAVFFAGHGFASLVIDYRGVGESAGGPVRGRDMRFKDWGTLDLEAALQWVVAREAQPTYLVGHSAGGQLFALAPSCGHLSGAIIISSLIPWWRYFPWPLALRLRLAQGLLLPLLSVGRDRFPARRLGISSVDVASGVVRQWATLGLRPEYIFDRNAFPGSHPGARLEIPLLVSHIDDDDYAPRAAIDALLARFPACPKEIWEIRSAMAPGGRIGHVGFFRSEMRRTFWGRMIDWLRQRPRLAPSIRSRDNPLVRSTRP